LVDEAGEPWFSALLVGSAAGASEKWETGEKK